MKTIVEACHYAPLCPQIPRFEGLPQRLRPVLELTCKGGRKCKNHRRYWALHETEVVLTALILVDSKHVHTNYMCSRCQEQELSPATHQMPAHPHKRLFRTFDQLPQDFLQPHLYNDFTLEYFWRFLMSTETPSGTLTGPTCEPSRHPWRNFPISRDP